MEPDWLKWRKQPAGISQNGLAYAQNADDNDY